MFADSFNFTAYETVQSEKRRTFIHRRWCLNTKVFCENKLETLKEVKMKRTIAVTIATLLSSRKKNRQPSKNLPTEGGFS